MNEINDGGPAFPLKDPVMSDALGASLRDWFAAKAMAALIPVEEKDDGQDLREYADEIAEGAYEYADAMLRAREKQS